MALGGTSIGIAILFFIQLLFDVIKLLTVTHVRPNSTERPRSEMSDRNWDKPVIMHS